MIQFLIKEKGGKGFIGEFQCGCNRWGGEEGVIKGGGANQIVYASACSTQVYGKHMGHKCELATSIATTTREELRSLSKKLGDHYDTVKKARRNVIDAKESILNTQLYLRDRIMKHMGVLRACMSRRETVLKCDVDDRTKQKIKPLDEQER